MGCCEIPSSVLILLHTTGNDSAPQVTMAKIGVLATLTPLSNSGIYKEIYYVTGETRLQYETHSELVLLSILNCPTL